MVSWNLAGIPAGELDTFVEHVSFHMMWDVMTIQEGFRKQEGFEFRRARAIHGTSVDERET